MALVPEWQLCPHPDDQIIQLRCVLSDVMCMLVLGEQLLVANKDAGTVIGRQGGTIQMIQSKTNCRVRVSNNGDYYPGTNDRVVLVTGTPESVTAGVLLVLAELYENAEELQKNGGIPVEAGMISVLIPDKASGLIIGRGGEVIREMVEQSGAKIQLTSKEKQIPGLDERVLTATGTVPQIKKAVELVVTKICADPTANYTNMTTQYSRYLAAAGGLGRGGGAAYGAMPGMGAYGAPAGMPGMPAMGAMGMDPYAAQMAAYGSADPYGYGAAYGGMAGLDQYGAAASAYGGSGPVPNQQGGITYTLHVPDAVVPAILGRGGVVIKELMQQSGNSCASRENCASSSVLLMCTCIENFGQEEVHRRGLAKAITIHRFIILKQKTGRVYNIQ